MQPKTQVAFRLRADLIERLDQWCAAQRPAVTKTAVLEEALGRFLDAQKRIGGSQRLEAVANGSNKEKT